jgi:hypothetical protein
MYYLCQFFLFFISFLVFKFIPKNFLYCFSPFLIKSLSLFLSSCVFTISFLLFVPFDIKLNYVYYYGSILYPIKIHIKSLKIIFIYFMKREDIYSIAKITDEITFDFFYTTLFFFFIFFSFFFLILIYHSFDETEYEIEKLIRFYFICFFIEFVIFFLMSFMEINYTSKHRLLHRFIKKRIFGFDYVD